MTQPPRCTENTEILFFAFAVLFRISRNCTSTLCWKAVENISRLLSGFVANVCSLHRADITVYSRMCRFHSENYSYPVSPEPSIQSYSTYFWCQERSARDDEEQMTDVIPTPMRRTECRTTSSASAIAYGKREQNRTLLPDPPVSGTSFYGRAKKPSECRTFSCPWTASRV